MTAWQKQRDRCAIWFLLPAMTLLGVFVLWPMARAGYWSFTNADLLAPDRATGIRWSNYSDLLVDPRFRRAFGNTALFALMVVPLQTVAAFSLALWVNRPEPAWRWLRVVFFVPVVVSMPVLAVLWSMLYQPAQGTQTGLVNAVLQTVGVPPQAWLRDPALALPAIAFMSLWQGVGLQMMIFLAGLQSVSTELLEAARIDGATASQRIRHVVLPALRNTIVFVVTVTTILAFRLFVQPYVMTQGGPGDRHALARASDLRNDVSESGPWSRECGRFRVPGVGRCAGDAATMVAAGGARMKRFLPWLTSLLVAAVFLAPLWWMIAASLRDEPWIFRSNIDAWLTREGWTWDNYSDAWRRAALGRTFATSMLQVALITGVGLLINAMAAFAFARLQFRGRDFLFLLVVVMIILPVEVLAVPMFLTARDLGLVGGYFTALGGLTVPFFAKAFNIYFLRQHFLNLPRELEEASVIDGAAVWRQFWSIALPSVRPALATVVVLDLLYHWGDFLWPLLVSTRDSTRTIQLGLANLFTQPPVQWGDILACAVLATLPVMAIFRLLQRYIVTTDARTGIK